MRSDVDLTSTQAGEFAMEDSPPKTIDVNLQKTSQYREVSCDGVFGGPAPHNKIWLGFYNERYPLPRITRYQLEPTTNETEFKMVEGSGEVIESKSGIIRNVEVGVFMTIESAEQLRDWLTSQIKESKGEK